MRTKHCCNPINVDTAPMIRDKDGCEVISVMIEIADTATFLDVEETEEIIRRLQWSLKRAKERIG